MKKLILILIVFPIAVLNAQVPSYQDKLIITCKIYGFMKSFHSEVSTCGVDWDKMTSDVLPLIKQSISKDSFNQLLMDLISKAGPMLRSNGIPQDTMQADLKINLDFTWFKDSILLSDVSDALDTIWHNFIPHASCWVENNDYNGSYSGWLVFPKDSGMYKGLTYSKFPNETQRIMMLFKYWNILKYFNPNSDILDQKWEETLKEFVIPITASNTIYKYYLNLKKISGKLNDVHAEGLTSSIYISPPTYYYVPEIKLQYIENAYTVVKSNIKGIIKGNTITKVNNRSIQSMEDSIRPYLSSGNEAVFHRSMCYSLLAGYSGTNLTIGFIDSNLQQTAINSVRTTYIYDNFFTDYYPNDTLKSISYKKINCDIGYVNMGVLQSNEVQAMSAKFKDASAVIFDIRNYPNGTAFDIPDYFFPNKRTCAKFKIPDVNFPGTFFWDSTAFGVDGNTGAYKGKVILLVNEETQSHAEYSAMILKEIPNAITVGSQTAGADGNISYFSAAWDLNLGYTSLGIYYPDGINAQRSGVKIDYFAYPTRLGIMKGKDEVLEKALNLANCWDASAVGLHNDKNYHIYPNPGNGLVTIEGISEPCTIEVHNALGELVLVQEMSGKNNVIDMVNFSNGLYILIIQVNEKVSTYTYLKSF